MGYIGNILDEAIADVAAKSQKRIYQTDFNAWSHDVLGRRYYRKLAEVSEEAVAGKKTRIAVKSANGCGKDLAIDTPMLTANGWSTMGDLKVGDLVYDENGFPTRIVWKSEVFNTPSYRVTFKDGVSLVASGTHEWNTLSLNARSHATGVTDWRDVWDLSKTLTTAEIANTLKNRAGIAVHAVPLAREVHYVKPQPKPTLDPYVLGAWLGDGHSNAPMMTIGDDGKYVIEEFAKCGITLRKMSGIYAYSFADGKRGGPGAGSVTGSGKYLNALRDLNVWKNKHIPDRYKYGTIAVRREVLRGLMDTDGFNLSGVATGVGIDLADLTLSEDVAELARGLGMKVVIRTSQNKDGFTRHRMSFGPAESPFTKGSYKDLAFKGQGSPQFSRQTARYIESVEEIPSVPTQCIQVDSKRHLYLAGEHLIPTHNSLWLADFSMWWVTAFPPEDSLAILSAPTLHQISNVLMAYLKTSYSYVLSESQRKREPFPFPGWINENLEWKYETPAGNQNILFGKRPSDRDIVSTFQGTRAKRTLVSLDEGGGIPQDLFTAAEAVATGQDSRIITIGNPDRRGTEFHRIFSVPTLSDEWHTHTISAYDLPTMTGELVYPNEPEKQARMLAGLTSRDWIEHKERTWATRSADGKLRWDARGLAKVLGEFPGETDNSFFPQQAIDLSHETEIDNPESLVIMGVDVAAGGSDESVVYVNRGGHVRLFDKTIHYDDGGEDRTTTGVWSKEDEVTSARRIHAIAKHIGADQVRVDAAGLGGGIYSMLMKLPEFGDMSYDVHAILGANSSSDRDRWANRRAENHDSLRRQMVDGLVDLDPADTELRDELLALTYELNNRGAVQITKKADMRNTMGGSPDRLDALIYAVTDTDEVYGIQPGEQITYNESEGLEEHPFYSGAAALAGW